MILGLAALLGFALLLSRISRLDLELSLPSAAAALILVLLAAAVFDHLPTVHTAVMVAGLGALAFCWKSWRAMLSPGMVLFFVGCATLYLLLKDSLALTTDELAVWGVASKYTLVTGKLPRSKEYLGAVDYPRGLAMFHYLMARVGGFTEGRMIVAQGIMQLALLLPLFAGLRWRDALLWVPLAVFAVLIGYSFEPTNYEGHLETLMADAPLGIAIASALIVYFRGGAGWRSILLSAPIVAILPHIKDTGLIFAPLVLGMIAVDQGIGWIERRKIDVRASAGVLGAIVLVLAGRALWSSFGASLGVAGTYPASLAYVAQKMEDPAFGGTLVTASRRWLFDMTGGIKFDALGNGILAWFILLICISALAAALAPSGWQRGRVATANLVMFAGIFLYSALLVVLFVLFWGVPEASILHSFDRYMMTPFIAWALLAVSFFTRRIVSAIAVGSFACGLVYMAWASQLLIRRHHVYEWELGQRKEAAQALGDLSRIPADARIYFLANGTKGWEYLTSSLFLRPRPISPFCFSVRLEPSQEDRWSCKKTPDEFRALVDGYDYLFISKADPQFWQDYGSLFPADEVAHRTGWFKINVGDPQPFKPV